MIEMPPEVEGETLTDTGQTIKHRGTTFRIFTTTDRRAESPYVLIRERKGPGCRTWILVRNVPKPHMLFGVSWGGTCKAMKGWFTDKDGTLRSLG